MSYNSWMEIITIVLVLLLGISMLDSSAFDDCEEEFFAKSIPQITCSK